MSILTDIFKPSTKKNWILLAQEIGGTFVDGGIWKTDKVVLAYRNTSITLHLTLRNYHTPKNFKVYTRVQCQFISTHWFTFKIRNESAFTCAGKTFGLNDVQIGDSRFDDKFHLKSIQKDKLIDFFSSEKLREQFFGILKSLHFKLNLEVIYTKQFAEAYDNNNPYKSLWIHIDESFVQSDIEKLKSWFNLCKITLDRLIEIGEAEE
jgi:hypothetical protein